MTQARFQSFEEFWPYYVGEHRDPLCRALHYVGTSLALGTIATAALTANPSWLLLTPVVGYGPAWFAHYFIENNRPATFKHPLWSLRGDFRMFSLALKGKMAAEVERLYSSDAGVPSTGGAEATRSGEATERVRAASPVETHTNGAPAL